MTDNEKKLGLLALLLWLLWPKSPSSSAVIPAGNTTVGFKSPSGQPLNIKPADGAQSIDANGNCYQYYAASNAWYPCPVANLNCPGSPGCPGYPADGQQAVDPTTGECIQYWASVGQWLSCGTGPA